MTEHSEHPTEEPKAPTAEQEGTETAAAGQGPPDAAPEAQYWAGVSRYKASGDPSHLGATGKRFTERYADSTWAKKASVWNT